MPRTRQRIVSLVYTLLLLTLSLTLAHPEDAAGSEAQDPDATAAAEMVEQEFDEDLALATFGVSAGFPSYQTYALNAGFRYEFIGLNARATYTPFAGLYAGASIRAYPPIPGIPLDMFLEAGGGVHDAGMVPFVGGGAHVPLSPELRLDLEGGAAFVPMINGRDTVPYVSVGVSYVFALDPADIRTGSSSRASTMEERFSAASGGQVCTEPTEPTSDGISGIVDDIVSDIVRQLRATYGAQARNVSYSYSVGSVSISGNNATASVPYRGSATYAGERHSISGTATATFRWTGCNWVSQGFSAPPHF